jgi:hypothetical protein
MKRSPSSPRRWRAIWLDCSGCREALAAGPARALREGSAWRFGARVVVYGRGG